MLRLELLELAHQRVVLGVGDRGLVEHMVAVVGLVDRGPKLARPPRRVAHGATWSGESNTICGASATSTSRGKISPQAAAAAVMPAACAARMSKGESPT